MSHAHRKHAWVKRRGAAVQQRRLIHYRRNVDWIRTIDIATLEPLCPDLTEFFHSIDDGLRNLPPAEYGGQISAETLRKIAEMFPDGS